MNKIETKYNEVKSLINGMRQDEEYTIERLIPITEAHKELGKLCHAEGDYKRHKRSRLLIEKVVVKCLDGIEVLQKEQDYKCSIFAQDNGGYSINVSRKVGEDYENVFSFKTYNESILDTLEDEPYNFYLRG